MVDDLHIIMHVPKTAGWTLRDHFRVKLAFHSEFIHLGPFGVRDAEERGLPPWEARSDAERGEARVIFGHYASVFTRDLVPGERAVKYSGLLRDPASRLVSHYNFNVEDKWIKQGKGVPDWSWWYRGQKRNFVCRWIKENFLREPVEGVSDEVMYEDVTRLLGSFWLLGVVERFDEFAQRLCHDIGIPPPASGQRRNASGVDHPQRLRLSDEIAETVYRDHPVDKAVYDWVCARTPLRLASEGA
jgi:hypothetical protein